MRNAGTRREYANIRSYRELPAGEAEETRVWLQFALHCKYIEPQIFNDLDTKYDLILGQLVRMIAEPEKWTIRQ